MYRIADLARAPLRRAAPASPRFRPRVEGLEDRTVPAFLPTTPDVTVSTHAGTPVWITLPASDPDNDPLTVTTTQPESGTVAPDGMDPLLYTYTPAGPFVGTVTFTYTATDVDGSSTGTVTVNVTNTPPVAPDAAATTPPGRDVLVLVSPSDPDDDPVTITLVLPLEHGTATCDGFGQITYTPAPGFADGVETIAYIASDGFTGGTTIGTITITVGPAPQVTATVVWQVNGPEIGQVTLTRTGGDLTQPLTVWFEPSGTATIDGESVTVVLAAIAEFGANATEMTIPILADAETGGFANVQMPGATVQRRPPDQSQQLGALSTDLQDISTPQFGAALLELPDVIRNLPSPVTLPEYRLLKVIMGQVEPIAAADPETLPDPAYRGRSERVVREINRKIGPGIDLTSVPQLFALTPTGGGIATYAALLAAAPDWATIEQTVAGLVANLSGEFLVREQAEADLTALVGGYFARGDLARAMVAVNQVEQAALSPDPEVSRRAQNVLNLATNGGAYLRYREAKLSAAAAVLGGWVYTP